MEYFSALKLLSLLLLVDLECAAGNYKTNDQLPNGIDWWQYGYISPAQNQGGFQASWAMGAAETYVVIKNRPFAELTAQQLIDRLSVWARAAFNYSRDHGIAQNASYLYRAEQSTCSYNPSTSEN